MILINNHEVFYSDSSEIKVTTEFFWNFPWMFSTKHCFERKYARWLVENHAFITW